MSPRNKCLCRCLLLAFFLIPGKLGLAQNPAPAPNQNVFIQFYQNHISAVDGNRCPMTPSCSAYAASAVKRHGPVIGWFMGCDRLVRCGRDEMDLSPVRHISGTDYAYDPVDANDFWWFEKKEVPSK